MKKHYLTLLTLGYCLLFYFNSCINKDYDWDNLNKEITFQIGNIPLGNVSPLRIDSILEERSETEFVYDSQGYITLNYGGDIEVQLPKFDEMNVPVSNSGKTHAPVVDNPTISQVISLTNDTKRELSYSIDAPEKKTSSDDWDIEVQGVIFKECDIHMEFHLSGVKFPELSESRLKVNVEFPEYFILDTTHPDIEGQVITIEIDPNQLTIGNISYGPLPIKEVWYDKAEEDLFYTAELNIAPNSGMQVGTDKTAFFELKMVTDNIQPDMVHALASFNQNIQGDVADINSINDIFQEEDDYFVFANPGMIMDITSNIDMNISLYMDGMEAQPSGKMENLTKEKGMIFGQGETSYYLAKENDMNYLKDYFFINDFNQVLSARPTHLTYQARAFAEREKAVFPYTNPQIDATYTFNVPLNFSEIQINIEETLEDVFSDDIAEKLFNNEGEFIISADEVIVQLGGTNGSNDVKLFITASVYDYYNELIDIEIEGATLSNGNNPMQITMKIKKEDTEKMKTAKHIGFTFKITGNNVKLNKSDHIAINKLKFKTTGGISWEF